MSRTIYGFCEAHCKEPVYSQEQTLSLLQQAIEAQSLQGIDPDASPIVALIRENNKRANIAFWVGTEAEYNALVPSVSAAMVMARMDGNGNIYLCKDDSTIEGWQQETIQLAIEAMEAVAATYDSKISAKADLTHASRHASGGADPITPASIGAAASGHTHTPASIGAAASNHTHTPASIGATSHITKTATLNVAGWSSNAQTVSVSGVTASNVVIVAPAPASFEDYGKAGIYCSAQASGSLTFKCSKTPTAAISVNIVILN